ncbi:MAG: transporter [Pseudomonadota bacterium]
MKFQAFAVKAIRSGVTLALACAWCAGAQATEGGGSMYPNGVDNFAAGAMPPPGTYGMLFGQHYTADQLNDRDGNRIPLAFKVTANVLAPRFIWVTGQKIAGGDLALHAIVPLVELDVAVGGARQKKSGLGDITTGFSLGYHHSPQLHTLAGIDFFLPTGGYDKNDMTNIGRNYWATEPVYIASYIEPRGLNADIKLGYLLNRENKDSHYRSGQEFHFDYALGWGVADGWVVGAGGYYYRQTTEDKANGASLAGSKGQAFAIGPSVKYDSGKGWFMTLKWQKESSVENRAQGKALWFKAVFPL